MIINPLDYSSIKYESGYMIIPKLVSPEGITLLRLEIEKLINSSKTTWLEKNSAKTSEGCYLVIRSIDTPSNFIFNSARDPTFINLAESFAKKRVTPLYTEFFNKPAYSNCPSPPHQDHAFYNEHFPDELGITFWIALEDCDSSNGCMHVKPQKEKLLFPHKISKISGFAYEMVDPDISLFQPIPLQAGDALVHGSFTPHYCPGNQTDRTRMAIAFSFRTSDYREQISPWKP